eukprot:SAG11_NODE_26466_length_344_cov_159.138776_1_plen_38_part_10
MTSFFKIEANGDLKIILENPDIDRDLYENVVKFMKENS